MTASLQLPMSLGVQRNSLDLESYNLENVEREVIKLVLLKHQGNVSQAARELGLTRTSVYRRMEKYGL